VGGVLGRVRGHEGIADVYSEKRDRLESIRLCRLRVVHWKSGHEERGEVRGWEKGWGIDEK